MLQCDSCVTVVVNMLQRVANVLQDSSLPVAVFVWSVENTGDEEAEVSIMFTFQSGQGGWVTGQDVSTNVFTSSEAGQPVSGVTIHQEFKDMPCVYAISAKQAV